MSDQLHSLLEKYTLSEDQIQRIFERLILPELKFYTPTNNPTGVIVGAQPGAGKSQILNLLKQEYSQNIVICNADDYRKFHPATNEILHQHESFFPDITTGLAQQLNLLLRNACKSNGLNFALEITMRNGAGANATIEGIIKSGFTCNIDLLAVNDKWSRLGTVDRLESQRAIEKYGRMVSSEAHDERYYAMPQAVHEINEKQLYTKLRIFGRALTTVDDRVEQKVVLLQDNPADPVAALQQERNRPFTLDEIRYYQKEVQRIENLLRMRNASIQEIKDFKNLFLPGADKITQKKGNRL
jgi:predicted ABC-type ATPase